MSDPRRRKDIKPGLNVAIVLKEDQPTGKLTFGTVKDILTGSAEHPRGIKVRLTTGQVGRVHRIPDEAVPQSQSQSPSPAPGPGPGADEAPKPKQGTVIFPAGAKEILHLAVRDAESGLWLTVKIPPAANWSPGMRLLGALMVPEDGVKIFGTEVLVEDLGTADIEYAGMKSILHFGRVDLPGGSKVKFFSLHQEWVTDDRLNELDDEEELCPLSATLFTVLREDETNAAPEDAN